MLLYQSPLFLKSSCSWANPLLALLCPKKGQTSKDHPALLPSSIFLITNKDLLTGANLCAITNPGASLAFLWEVFINECFACCGGLNKASSSVVFSFLHLLPLFFHYVLCNWTAANCSLSPQATQTLLRRKRMVSPFPNHPWWCLDNPLLLNCLQRARRYQSPRNRTFLPCHHWPARWRTSYLVCFWGRLICMAASKESHSIAHGWEKWLEDNQPPPRRRGIVVGVNGRWGLWLSGFKSFSI